MCECCSSQEGATTMCLLICISRIYLCSHLASICPSVRPSIHPGCPCSARTTALSRRNIQTNKQKNKPTKQTNKQANQPASQTKRELKHLCHRGSAATELKHGLHIMSWAFGKAFACSSVFFWCGTLLLRSQPGDLATGL